MKYETKRKVLTYLGAVQSVNGEFLQVQYLKGSRGKTFTLKEEDQDEINLKSILPLIKQFLVNLRGQYIVDIPLPLDMQQSHNS